VLLAVTLCLMRAGTDLLERMNMQWQGSAGRPSAQLPPRPPPPATPPRSRRGSLGGRRPAGGGGTTGSQPPVPPSPAVAALAAPTAVAKLQAAAAGPLQDGPAICKTALQQRPPAAAADAAVKAEPDTGATRLQPTQPARQVVQSLNDRFAGVAAPPFDNGSRTAQLAAGAEPRTGDSGADGGGKHSSARDGGLTPPSRSEQSSPDIVHHAVLPAPSLAPDAGNPLDGQHSGDTNGGKDGQLQQARELERQGEERQGNEHGRLRGNWRATTPLSREAEGTTRRSHALDSSSASSGDEDGDGDESLALTAAPQADTPDAPLAAAVAAANTPDPPDGLAAQPAAQPAEQQQARQQPGGANAAAASAAAAAEDGSRAAHSGSESTVKAEPAGRPTRRAALNARAKIT